MSKTKIRVLCVDDHRLVLEGIARIIELHSDMRVVATATRGEEALQQFILHRPDITLMDLRLSGMSGLEAIHAIRSESPDARIVVLTMYRGEEDIYQALHAGCVGYLVKDSLAGDLIRVIREAYAGGRPIPADVSAQFELRAGRATLSFREHKVLKLVAKGMRNKEIGTAIGIAADTVEVYVKNIFKKLNIHDRISAVDVAIRRGIIDR